MPSGGYYAYRNTNQTRERQIPYVITYVWKLKNKTNGCIYKNKNKLTDTENKPVGRGKRGGKRLGQEIKRYTLRCIK